MLSIVLGLFVGDMTYPKEPINLWVLQKATLVSLQCLFHFIVNRSVGRCVMEKGGGKQGQGEADPCPFTQQFSP